MWTQGQKGDKNKSIKIHETSALIQVEAIGHTQEGRQTKPDRKQVKSVKSKVPNTIIHKSNQNKITSALTHQGNKENLAQKEKGAWLK